MQKTTPQLSAPPPIDPLNVFPISWPKSPQITYDLFELAKTQLWDPKKLPWETLAEARISAEEDLEMIVPVF